MDKFALSPQGSAILSMIVEKKDSDLANSLKTLYSSSKNDNETLMISIIVSVLSQSIASSHALSYLSKKYSISQKGIPVTLDIKIRKQFFELLPNILSVSPGISIILPFLTPMLWKISPKSSLKSIIKISNCCTDPSVFLYDYVSMISAKKFSSVVKECLNLSKKDDIHQIIPFLLRRNPIEVSQQIVSCYLEDKTLINLVGSLLMSPYCPPLNGNDLLSLFYQIAKGNVSTDSLLFSSLVSHIMRNVIDLGDIAQYNDNSSLFVYVIEECNKVYNGILDGLYSMVAADLVKYQFNPVFLSLFKDRIQSSQLKYVAKCVLEYKEDETFYKQVFEALPKLQVSESLIIFDYIKISLFLVIENSASSAFSYVARMLLENKNIFFVPFVIRKLSDMLANSFLADTALEISRKFSPINNMFDILYFFLKMMKDRLLNGFDAFLTSKSNSQTGVFVVFVIIVSSRSANSYKGIILQMMNMMFKAINWQTLDCSIPMPLHSKEFLSEGNVTQASFSKYINKLLSGSIRPEEFTRLNVYESLNIFPFLHGPLPELNPLPKFSNTVPPSIPSFGLHRMKPKLEPETKSMSLPPPNSILETPKKVPSQKQNITFVETIENSPPNLSPPPIQTQIHPEEALLLSNYVPPMELFKNNEEPAEKESLYIPMTNNFAFGFVMPIGDMSSSSD